MNRRRRVMRRFRFKAGGKQFTYHWSEIEKNEEKKKQPQEWRNEKIIIKEMGKWYPFINRQITPLDNIYYLCFVSLNWKRWLRTDKKGFSFGLTKNPYLGPLSIIVQVISFNIFIRHHFLSIHMFCKYFHFLIAYRYHMHSVIITDPSSVCLEQNRMLENTH